MDPSKPGRGILASLEHKPVEAPRRHADATPSAWRGATLAVGAVAVIGALLAWWLSGGPSPVIVQEALPPMMQATAPTTSPVTESGEAATIVDEAPMPALAAVLAPAPSASAPMRQERAANARPQPKPRAKRRAPAHGKVRAVPRMATDTDVALLAALVTHANERDVVELRSSDSVDSLMQRCRHASAGEDRLCRIRICSRHTGDDGCQSR